MSGQARRRLLAVFFAVFVVASSVAGVAGVASVVDVASADQHIQYVDKRAGTFFDDYCGPEEATSSSIQDAINASDSGGVVVICDGTYEEAVTVDKRLEIRVDSSEAPVRLNGNGDTETAITIGPSADGTTIKGGFNGPTELIIGAYNSSGVRIESASNVTVGNTTFDELDGPAVDVRNASDVSVTDIDVRDSSVGVATDNASAVAVTNSSFRQVSGSAVDLEATTAVSVTGLSVTTSSTGLSAANASDVTVSDTLFERLSGPAVELDDTRGAVVRETWMSVTGGGVVATSSEDVTVASARFDLLLGGPSVEFVNASGSSVRGSRLTNGSRGVIVRSSSGVAVVGTRFDGSSGTSVNLTRSENTTVRSVTVSNGSGGVLARGGTNLTVSGSTFDGTPGPAVNTTGSNDVLVRDTNVTNASVGVTANSTPAVRVIDVRADGLSGHTVELSNATGARIERLDVSNGSEGVLARSSSNLSVLASTFDGTPGPAVDVARSSGVLVDGTNVTNASAGVVADSTPGIQVVDVRAIGVGGTAVELTNATGATVERLTVSNASDGIVATASANVTVSGARVENASGTAVGLTNPGGALVRDVVVGNTDTGVAIDATGSGPVSNVTVRDVTVVDGSRGVRVNASGGVALSGLDLSGLDLSGNDYGVGLYASGGGSDVSSVTIADSTINDSATRGVEVSTVDGDPSIANVTLRDLTLEGAETGTGIYLSAQDDGSLREVALRNSSVASHEAGVVLVEEGTVENVTVIWNSVSEAERGVVLDGEGGQPFRGVALRQNIVADASDAGVFVTDDTDARELRVTRNVIRDNARGVVNEGDGDLAAWLNYWGDVSGPSGGEEDPRTGTEAGGVGDEVSEDVAFDPWLGKGACSEPEFGNVSTGPLDLYGESIGLAEFRSFCAWDRAPLSLRSDPDDAAMSVSNLNLSYELEGVEEPVSANRPNVSIYEAGEEFDLQFGAGPTDTSRFAENETQLIVLRDNISTNASFDVRFDDWAGETVLRSDADSATVRDWGEPDSNGHLNESFTPELAGSYTFVLVRPDVGPGVENASTRGEVRLDGGATVLGFETVVVRERDAVADATTDNDSYPAGSNVPFDLVSGLPDESTEHAVLFYEESRFRDATATVGVDATAADVVAGRITADDVTVESSISDLNGFYRGTPGFSRLGVDVASLNKSGLVNPSPFLGLGTRLYGPAATAPSDAAGATPLNGSVVVTRSEGPNTTVDVETFRNVSTGTYRYVYLAGGEGDRGTSATTGLIEITTPVATSTPTPTPGDGGGGGDSGGSSGGGGGAGGGQPGGGSSGEVEIRDVTLLNETVTTTDSVVVRVDLANFDPVDGRITLTLASDGVTVAERTVTVGASSRRTITLSTTFRTPGTYDLAFDGEPLGTVTVTAAETGTPTVGRTPTAGPTPTATGGGDGGTGESTATAPPGAGDGGPGTASPSPEAVASGPPPATGTEVVIALGMALLLLYGVGVAVYVLREHPPPGFE